MPMPIKTFHLLHKKYLPFYTKITREKLSTILSFLMLTYFTSAATLRVELSRTLLSSYARYLSVILPQTATFVASLPTPPYHFQSIALLYLLRS
jgi:hypothetical protein